MILDNIKEIEKLDSQNMLGSLQLLSKQIEEVLESSKKLKVPASYKQINKILVLGMGGSALGAHIFKSVFKAELKVPVEILNDYNVPQFTDNKTLVIGSSYSGNTEEVVSALKQAKVKKSKIIIISSGGKLASFAKLNKLPALIFSTNNNPCGSPRMGLGYSIVGQLILLGELGLIKLTKKQINELALTFIKYDSLFGVTVKTKNNPAKMIARDIGSRSMWYVGAEHLSGNVHTAANQMNENAKRFAGYFLIPELNHHLLEGMLNPKSNQTNLFFLFFDSKLYHKRIQKRFEITSQVLDKNKINYAFYSFNEKDKLRQACEALVLGSYVSYYRALLDNIDPTDIPYVDYFKLELAK